MLWSSSSTSEPLLRSIASIGPANMPSIGGKRMRTWMTFSSTAILASIDYIHNNPVQRKLCKRAIDWKWSSARKYLLPEAPLDSDLPQIHGLPAEFWDGVAGKWTEVLK